MVAFLLMGTGSFCAFSQTETSKDSIKKNDLKEVVVKGKKIRHDGMKDILLLGKDNRNFGSNALDAISSLPLFKTTVGEKSLSTLEGQNVFILINGIPSDGNGLRSYQGDEIAKVEFFQIAPPEYMIYTKGAVVNIIIKRPKKRMYSAYLNSVDDPIDFYSGDAINLTYADSLNQVKVNYNLAVQDKKMNTSSNNIDYQDGSYSGYRSTDYRSIGNSHTLSASYQRFQGKHLFNVEAAYSWTPYSRSLTRGLATYRDPSGKEYSGEGGSYLLNKNRRGYINLYYAYSFDYSSKFAINVVNTWGHAVSRNNIWRNYHDHPGLDYNIDNNIDNHTYSLGASAYYYRFLFKGLFSAGMNWMYSRLNQKDSGIETIPETNSGRLYAGWQRTWGFFSFMPSIGMDVYLSKDQIGKQSYTIPFVQISLRATGKGRFSGFVSNLSLRMSHTTPATSSLALNTTNITDKLVSIGNPDLKRSVWTSASLNLRYVFHNNSVLSLNYGPTFKRHSIAPVLFQREGITYIQNQNISNTMENTVSLYSDIKLLRWLSVSPSVGYSHISFRTPTQHINDGRWSYSAGINFSFKGWYMAVFSNVHLKSYNGDFIDRAAGQHGALVNWKYKTFSIQARYNYYHHAALSRSAVLDRFRYRNVEDGRRNSLLFIISYYFSHGKARNHDNKILNNYDSNTGLSDYNTVKTN